jgi:hypothetical protein
MSVDWNYIIKTTPGVIRASIIILLAGVIAAFGTIVVISAFRGTKVSVTYKGIELAEYRSPEVQKCEAAVAGLQSSTQISQDAHNNLQTQILQNLTLYDKFNQQAAQIAIQGQDLPKANYPGSASIYREEAQKLFVRIAGLRSDQADIERARNSASETFQHACQVR